MHLNYAYGLNVVGKPTKAALSLACDGGSLLKQHCP